MVASWRSKLLLAAVCMAQLALVAQVSTFQCSPSAEQLASLPFQQLADRSTTVLEGSFLTHILIHVRHALQLHSSTLITAIH